MATFIVTNTNSNGSGSLRQAIQDANASSGADTIEFDSSLQDQTINLANSGLRITDDLNIDGEDIGITIDGDGAEQVFTVENFSHAIFDGLTITGGSESGVLAIDGEKIEIRNSLVTGNDGTGLRSSSAIGEYENYADILVSNSTISDNNGNGITPRFSYLEVIDSQILSNSGDGVFIAIGDELDGAGDVSIIGSTISGNAGSGLRSSAYYNTISITGSTISSNREDGIYADKSTRLILDESKVYENEEDGIETGRLVSIDIFNSSIFKNKEQGIRLERYSTLEISGSAFYENTGAGISLGNESTTSIENSTIQGNKDGGILETERGYFFSGIYLSIVGSTISGNTTLSNTAAGIGTEESNTRSRIHLDSSIVSGNSSSEGPADLDELLFVSAANSLIGSGQVDTDRGNNLIGVDPLLDPNGLQDNGGPTPTIALQSGSPAINAGSNPNQLATDQRGTGFAREVGGQADIGAFEVQSGLPPTNQIFTIVKGSGTTTIANFGGFGPATQPTAQALLNLDTLRFRGSGLTARNLLVRNKRGDLVLEFDGIANTRVVLSNFQLQNLENSNTVGNIIFDGQSRVTNSFDVTRDSANPSTVFNRNTVTFLGDRNNRISGRNNSNDVINAQAGDDRVFGLTGNDLLRGKAGNDTLGGGGGRDLIQGGDGRDEIFGGGGNDSLFGGNGGDTIRGNENNDFISGDEGFDTLTGGSGRDIFAFSGSTTRSGRLRDLNTDRITDFKRGQDKIGLSKQTFTALNRSGGRLKASDFASVANDNQVARNSRKIVFSRSSGRVFYNSNGAGSGLGADGSRFAILEDISNLSANDFTLI